MELAKRQSHMTGAMVGFAKVPPYDRVFERKTKPRLSKDVGGFFKRLQGAAQRD